jgi:hypothetical protein
MRVIRCTGRQTLPAAGGPHSQPSQRATLLSGYASFGSAANRFDKAFEVLLDR